MQIDDDVFHLFLQKQKRGAELHIYLEEGTWSSSLEHVVRDAVYPGAFIRRRCFKMAENFAICQWGVEHWARMLILLGTINMM